MRGGKVSGSIEIECVVDISAKTGEGAFWDALRQRLWWVDIPEGLVYCFDPSTGENQRHAIGEPVGCLAPSIKGDLILATRSGY